MARRLLLPVFAGAALAAAAGAVSATPARAAPGDTQTQTCPVLGNDPDPVTLQGPASLWPPNGTLVSYGINASETAAEKNDGAPHGVTIAFTVTTIDTPPGSANGATPSSGSAAGDFSITSFFQLKADRPATARTYQVDWMASFDGSNGVSVHKCSSTDGTHQPFIVTVAPPTVVAPETPLAVMLPLGGLLAGAAWLVYSRRREIGNQPQ